MSNKQRNSDLAFDMILDLVDVRPSDDGGATGLKGLKYQYHFAAYKCFEMLLNPGTINYVACELQDDVVVKLGNGRYEFYQAKERRGDQWKISTLKSEGIWTHFRWLQQEFGNGHKYLFVSDQSAQNRVSNKPDLGKLKDLTDMGKEYCSDLEQITVAELIDKLVESVDGASREEFERLFWNIQLLTGFYHKPGLIEKNLNRLEEVLLARGIESDVYGRRRIYNSVLSLLESSVADPPPEATYRDRLEMRKTNPQQVIECFVGPFKNPHLTTFKLLDGETQSLTLRQKSDRGGFPDTIIRYFLESRNYFEYRYREDSVHAAEYLCQLRLKVWGICSSVRISNSLGGSFNLLKTYQDINEELKSLAIEENKGVPSPSIIVNHPYLHGIMCQLTAECDNDWLPIK